MNRQPRPSIYLDHAATTPLRDEVLDAMLPFLRGEYGNASSAHGYGRRARVAVDAARETVARVIGCEPGEVLFTSGGTEANNAALVGVLTSPEQRASGRTGLVTSRAEHEAVRRTASRLAEDGHAVHWVDPMPTGAVDPTAVAATLEATEGVGLVSVMLANNEVGALTDVPVLANECRERGVLVHTDAVQAAGLLPVQIDGLGVDLLTLSAHKIGGPKGVGALVVRNGTPFRPLVVGGAQERGRRGGTENVAAVVGFAHALTLAEAEREGAAVWVRALRDGLRSRLANAVGAALQVNTPEQSEASAPHILSVSVRPGPAGPLDGDLLLMSLDLDGVAVSAGSACTSGALEPSAVLLAMGVDRATAGATVRFSLGRTTMPDEVDAGADAFIRIVRRLMGP